MINALLFFFFGKDVSSPRSKVWRAKMHTDACRHHEFAFLAHFLWNCIFHQLKGEGKHSWQKDGGTGFWWLSIVKPPRAWPTKHLGCVEAGCAQEGGDMGMGRARKFSGDTLVYALPQSSLQRWVWPQTHHLTIFSIYSIIPWWEMVLTRCRGRASCTASPFCCAQQEQTGIIHWLFVSLFPPQLLFPTKIDIKLVIALLTDNL